jgi:hypothetical protein
VILFNKGFAFRFYDLFPGFVVIAGFTFFIRYIKPVIISGSFNVGENTGYNDGPFIGQDSLFIVFAGQKCAV